MDFLELLINAEKQSGDIRLHRGRADPQVVKLHCKALGPLVLYDKDLGMHISPCRRRPKPKNYSSPASASTFGVGTGTM